MIPRSRSLNQGSGSWLTQHKVPYSRPSESTSATAQYEPAERGAFRVPTLPLQPHPRQPLLVVGPVVGGDVHPGAPPAGALAV